MYFSYCISHYDEEEQRTERNWTTVEVSEDKKVLTNNHGVKTPLTKAFLRYPHVFHDSFLSDSELNKTLSKKK